MQKLAEICVRRPVFATMLILSITVVGAFSFRSLGVDLFPKIDLPTITVTVVNPGASPQEIETEITDKVEGAVNTISGIDELRSTSVEGVSQVFITFLLDKNADVAAQEVRNKVDLIVNDLPETAEVPIVQKLDTDATPVLRIAVSAPRSLREVTDIADKQIKRQIEPISGVGNVEIVGGREREIEVWVDTDKMRAYNVSAADVAKRREASEHGAAGRPCRRRQARAYRAHDGPHSRSERIQQPRHRKPRHLLGEAERHWLCRRWRRRATNGGATEWTAGRDTGRFETVWPEHGCSCRRRQRPAERTHQIKNFAA